MEFGLGVLGLAPTQFWTMTPRELHAAYAARTGAYGESKPIERARFEHLMATFPDKDKN
jgi:uncharacterized phage protein (TIGR02216 family)